MNNLKKYSKPVMQMEQFVPQEYVAACWRLNVWCEGPLPSAANGTPQVFVVNMEEGDHVVGQMSTSCEGGHLCPPPIYATTESPDIKPDISVLKYELYGFHAAIATDEALNQNHSHLMENKPGHYTEGFSWTVNGQYHFFREPNWELRANPNSNS